MVMVGNAMPSSIKSTQENNMTKTITTPMSLAGTFQVLHFTPHDEDVCDYRGCDTTPTFYISFETNGHRMHDLTCDKSSKHLSGRRSCEKHIGILITQELVVHFERPVLVK